MTALYILAGWCSSSIILAAILCTLITRARRFGLQGRSAARGCGSMTRPSQAQFNAVIRSMNGLLAYKKLRSMGYDVTQLECREARTAFTGRGYKQNRVVESTEAERITRISAKAGCDALLRAQLLHGQHWISDAGRFARVCKSVGLTA